MATKKTLRAAMIGLRHGHMGSIGPEKPGFIHTFRQLDGVEVVAYCEDTQPELMDAAREHDPGAHTYSSIDDLIAREDFDIAAMTLPSSHIPPAGIKLAEAGKHFYMEKQFARNSADLGEMARVVRRTGVKVLAGYPHPFSPAMQALKGFIDDGVLGKPLSIEARQVTSQVRPGSRKPGHFMYTDKEEGGGILHMLGGHQLSVMRFLMGCEVKAVQAITSRQVGYIEEPLEDVAVLALEYENGALGTLHAGYVLPGPLRASNYLAYRGLEGWAEWPWGAGKLDIASTSPDWSDEPQRALTYKMEPYSGYGGSRHVLDWVQGFVDDIRAGRDSSMSETDGLRVLQSIDAAYESARTGRRVDVEYGD